MPVLKTEFACPRCKRETGKSVQIMAAEGRLTCPENSNHRWEDTGAFYADGPQMEFKVGPAKFPPVEGQTPVTIKIPQRIKDLLDQQWGPEKLNTEIATLLLHLSEGPVMVVSQVDRDRIDAKLGRKSRDSSELYGNIYAMMSAVEEANAAKEEMARDLQAYESRSPGRVVVDLGDQYAATVEKAKSAEQPLSLFIQTNLNVALSNNWF